MSQDKNIVKINREKISSDQVRKNENFEGIVDNHRRITKRPVYKQKRFYFILFLVLLITFLIYYAEKEEKEKDIPNTEGSN